MAEEVKSNIDNTEVWGGFAILVLQAVVLFAVFGAGVLVGKLDDRLHRLEQLDRENIKQKGTP